MVTEAEFLNFASRCSCSQHNRTVQHPFRSKFTLLEHVVRCCRKRVPTEIILAHVRSLHPTTDNMEVPSQRAEAFKSPEVPFVSISSNSSLFINIVFMLICGKANKAGVRETGQLSTRFHFFHRYCSRCSVPKARFTFCWTWNNSLFSSMRKF